MRTLLLCISALFSFQMATAQQLAVTSNEKGLYGYIDATSLQEVIPCIYKEAKPFNAAGYAVVNKKGKYGMVDRTGQEVVTPEYDEITSFKKGCAVVTKGKKKGLVSENGKLLTEVVYNFISDFNVYDLAWVNIGGKVNSNFQNAVMGGKWGVVTTDGTLRVPCNYKALYEFSKETNKEGGFGNILNNSLTVWHERDTLVTDCKYLAASLKKFTALWGELDIIDGNGNVVMPADKNNVSYREPKSGMIWCLYKIDSRTNGQRYFNCDTRQYITIDNMGSDYSAGDFTQQIAPIYVTVDKNTKYTVFVTKDGETSGKYDYTKYLATSESTGLWVARGFGKCSLFDTNKEVIIPEGKFSFIHFPDYSLPEFPGYAVRDTEGKWGVVDKALNEQVAFKYKALFPCGNWFYAQDDNSLWGIVDERGNTVMNHMFHDFSYSLLVKKPEVIYAKETKNSAYRLYNIAEKKLYPEEYAKVSVLDKDYAWVEPVNPALFNKKYADLTVKHIIPEEVAAQKAAGAGTTTIPVGFVIDNHGNHVVQSPITLRMWQTFRPEVYRKAKLGKRLTLSDEHRILLKMTRKQRVYDMKTIIEKVEWDF